MRFCINNKLKHRLMRRLLLQMVIGAVVAFATSWAQSPPVADLVDPFIGTAGGGNTFPGALVPWGMVSVSPHTSPSSPSGYLFGQPYFYGFGHVHLSGTGCADLGSIILGAARDTLAITPDGYRTPFSHEYAQAGYYRLTLDSVGLDAEVTASTRSGITRFTARSDGSYLIFIDAGRNLSIVGGGAVCLDSLRMRAEGMNLSGGFCGEANRQAVYFAAQLSAPSLESGCWKGDRMLPGNMKADTLGAPCGVWFRCRLKKGERLEVRLGISYVSTENAKLNLATESAAKPFDAIRQEAKEAWERELGLIQVEGGTPENLVKFYTALYHTLIHPNIISDANGEYPLMGRAGTGRAHGRERYSVFSLWDTYRTLHPLLTLFYPERQRSIIRTMLEMYRESGWLPKWELIANETYMMAGDPASVVIADSYVKGLRGFDSVLAYEAMMKPVRATTADSAPPIRAGYHEFLRYGYIPFDQDRTKEWWVWGPVSVTLEYCLEDYAIAQMAVGLGKQSEAKEFLRRSRFYQNLFDPESQLLRPRLRNGMWLTPFDPLATEGSGDWAGSGGPGYVEGNAWHYTWCVPHDVHGLAGLFGGSKRCAQKLDSAFENGQFTITNEPDMGYPYLFTQLEGEEANVAPLVNRIMNEEFTTGPAGLPGNDDAGTISAWFVFSALGFYPLLPASDTYALGIPLFERARLRLAPQGDHPGAECVIRREGRIGENPRLAAFLVNGRATPGFTLRHQAITDGAALTFRFR